MNSTDFAVIQAVTRFYRAHCELPRLTLVHPSWFQRLTIERVYVHIPRAPLPALPYPLTEREDAGDAEYLRRSYQRHVVLLHQLDLQSLPKDVRYRLPQSEWVLCLRRKDILMNLEMNAERTLPAGLTMASVMEISEDERYWLEHKRARDEVEREY